MHLHQSGCLAQCLNLLAIALKLSGEGELLRENLLNTATIVVERQNRPSDVERMFLECLQVRLDVLPSNHAELVNSYNSLGKV